MPSTLPDTATPCSRDPDTRIGPEALAVTRRRADGDELCAKVGERVTDSFVVRPDRRLSWPHPPISVAGGPPRRRHTRTGKADLVDARWTGSRSVTAAATLDAMAG